MINGMRSTNLAMAIMLAILFKKAMTKKIINTTTKANDGHDGDFEMR